MSIITNIRPIPSDLSKKFDNLANVFIEENWSSFYSIYEEDEQTLIKENLTAIKNKLNEIAQLPQPIVDATLKTKLEELDNIFKALPAYQRQHFENALKNEAKKHGLENLVEITTPITNPTYDPSQPLVFHLAGTEVKNNTLGDPLANLAREQSNFYIQEGVGKYFGSKGRENVENIITDIRQKYTYNANANKRIILTGYSRGAAAQIFLANRIHEEFNKGKPESEWVKIDMFLVDPTMGVADSSTGAVTREYVIPRCVNTLTMIHSNPETPEKDWFLHPWLITKRTRDTLKSDPHYTTIQSITLKDDHKGVGLLAADLTKRASSYVTDALCRLFFAHAGRETIATDQPKLNHDYIKKNVVATKQSSVAMQYYSSYATRLEGKQIPQVDRNAIQFCAQIPQLLVSPYAQADKQAYHDLMMKMFGAIILGDYQTRFFGLTGEKHQDRESKLPANMFKICEKIETYCRALQKNNAPDPEAAFKEIQTIAATATHSGNIMRKGNINAFLLNLTHSTDTPESGKTQIDVATNAVNTATSYLMPKRPGS
jgi:hypothetical protein